METGPQPPSFVVRLQEEAAQPPLCVQNHQRCWWPGAAEEECLEQGSIWVHLVQGQQHGKVGLVYSLRKLEESLLPVFPSAFPLVVLVDSDQECCWFQKGVHLSLAAL